MLGKGGGGDEKMDRGTVARVLGLAAWGEKEPSVEAWERKREHMVTGEMSSVRERSRGVTGEMSSMREREREQKVKRE